jgi:hypothetical protein
MTFLILIAALAIPAIQTAQKTYVILDSLKSIQEQDQKIASEAQSVTRQLNQVLTLNDRIHETRLTCPALLAEPPLLPPAKALVSGLVTAQEVLMGKIRLSVYTKLNRKVRWQTPKREPMDPCGLSGRLTWLNSLQIITVHQTTHLSKDNKATTGTDFDSPIEQKIDSGFAIIADKPFHPNKFSWSFDNPKVVAP